MADQLINSLNSGSINDSSLGLIGDPITGTLTQTGYHAMKDYFTAGITGSGGNINTGSLATTASLNLFTASYYIDSASFNLHIANTFASESNYLLTSSFTLFSASIVSQLTGSSFNSGSLLTTSSFNAFSSSYSVDSGSFNTRINNVYASESNYTLTSSFGIVSSSLYTVSQSEYTLSQSVVTLSSSFVGSSYNPGQLNAFSASML